MINKNYHGCDNMNLHMKSREGKVVISAQIEEDIIKELDEIKRKLNFKHRSQVVRMALKLFVANQ